jgi:hypothetical protein
MSKDLFLMMREQEVMTDNFLPTKKEITQTSKDFAKKIIEDGEHNLYEVFAQSTRLKEALTVVEKEIKSKLPDESFESFGIKGSFRNGGAIPQYEDDYVYFQLKKQLDNRKLLLDTALKSEEPIYDNEGIEVPKVSKKQRKSSLAITF